MLLVEPSEAHFFCLSPLPYLPFSSQPCWLITLFPFATQATIRGTWSPVTVGSHLRDGRWSSATSAAYGYICHVRRSRSPTFPTSFTVTSAGTCGGRDTKKTRRDVGTGGIRSTRPPRLCCPLTLFFDAYSLNYPQDGNCILSFVSIDNHNHSYLSLTVFFLKYFFWLLWRTGPKATTTAENHLFFFNELIPKFDWLSYIRCWCAQKYLRRSFHINWRCV